MKLRVFTLRYDRSLAVFDDSALQEFLSTGVETIEVREHFFECDGHPAWALLISYRDAADTLPISSRTGPRRRESAQGDLSDQERSRFEALRAWRNARASRDGKPPYVLLTNRQLTAIAMRNPDTPAALGEVEGIGEGKMQDFGAEVLQILAATRPALSSEHTDNEATGGA